tara:strand:+ start:11523 stop:12347 length:825 start_codon:yes stop_codon:yes gene_type:complete
MFYNIKEYPDKTSYAQILCSVPTLVFRVNTYADLWHLNQVVDAYNHQDVTPTIIIPNLIDAQADRRFNDNESSGLKLVCNFLNGMKANFKIFHPHNAEVVEALIDNVEIIDNYDFIYKALTNISIANEYNCDENLVLISSDAGGFKPLMKLCDQLKWGGQVHSCSKGRSYDGNKSELTQRVGKEDFFGKDVLIVDDICVYGGTFKGLAKLLRQRNVGKLYLATSHITIQNHAKDSVFDYFDHVYTTNSKFDTYWATGSKGEPVTPNNLTIIKQF